MHEKFFKTKFSRIQMKKIYLSIVLASACVSVFAQDNTGGVITASEFHVTRPLSEIFAENPVNENKIYTEKESRDREHRIQPKYDFTAEDGVQYGNDVKSIQDRMGDITGDGIVESEDYSILENNVYFIRAIIQP